MCLCGLGIPIARTGVWMARARCGFIWIFHPTYDAFQLQSTSLDATGRNACDSDFLPYRLGTPLANNCLDVSSDCGVVGILFHVDKIPELEQLAIGCHGADLDWFGFYIIWIRHSIYKGMALDAAGLIVVLGIAAISIRY